MTNEVHYLNPKTGQERMLPEGLGETMGFERVASYSPPELDETKLTDRESEVQHSASIIIATLANGYETLSLGEQVFIENLAIEFSNQKIQVLALMIALMHFSNAWKSQPNSMKRIWKSSTNYSTRC